MSPAFALHLQSPSQHRVFDEVTGFVATDASGSFGLLPGHARMMTALSSGLARFRTRDGGWHYVAQPGAIALFGAGALRLSTRRFFLGEDYRTVAEALARALGEEAQALQGLRESVTRLEREAVRRLWRAGEEEA